MAEHRSLIIQVNALGGFDKNEALINLALAGTNATVVCSYDAGELRPSVLADACRTHPVVISRGAQQATAVYQGPAYVPAAVDRHSPLRAGEKS